MKYSTNRVAIRGSERHPVAGARAVGSVPQDERFQITVRVRPKSGPQGLASADALQAELPQRRKYMTREEYAEAHGADPADLAKVEDFARQHGLVVVDKSAARRSVFLSGTAAQFASAFGVSLERYEHDTGTYRGRTGPLMVPAELTDVIEVVFGIDDRPVAKPHLQRWGVRPQAAGASFTPPQLAALYDFPAGLDGAGQCIAIIELGGGYRTADIKKYFQNLGLPVPDVKAVSVDGGRNHPTTADSPDGEVMLDIEVAAAVAPKAKIVVYFAPNTDDGFLNAITAAIHDAEHNPSVISISWGSPEKNWSAQSMSSYDAAFQEAAMLGVTVCCAAGDAGSGDENPDRLAEIGVTPDGLAHADFPGSSPHVLCCGGTKLVANGGSIASETVWNEDSRRSATGGGISDFFALPAYQQNAGVPPSANPGGRIGRGVPDVAGDADPATGYDVRVDGQDFVIGGTSAVAPLWSGLIALLNQKLGQRVGFLNPLLYGGLAGNGAMRDITSGNNGAYAAKQGWDACTGWGSPNGAKLLAALQGNGHAAAHDGNPLAGERLEAFRAPSGRQAEASVPAAAMAQVNSIVSVASHTFTFKENSNTPGRMLEQSVVVNVPSGAGWFISMPYLTGAFTSADFQHLTERPLGQFFVSAGLRGNNLVCRVRLTDSNSDDPVFIEATAVVVFFN